MAVRMLEKVQKQPDPQRQMPALRKDRMDADRRRGELVEHAHQPASRDIRADLPPRAPCEPITLEAPLVQHGTVRALHRAGYLDRHDLVALLEHPAALLVGARAEREAVVMREIGQRMRRTAPAQI